TKLAAARTVGVAEKVVQLERKGLRIDVQREFDADLLPRRARGASAHEAAHRAIRRQGLSLRVALAGLDRRHKAAVFRLSRAVSAHRRPASPRPTARSQSTLGPRPGSPSTRRRAHQSRRTSGYAAARIRAA